MKPQEYVIRLEDENNGTVSYSTICNLSDPKDLQLRISPYIRPEPTHQKVTLVSNLETIAQHIIANYTICSKYKECIISSNKNPTIINIIQIYRNTKESIVFSVFDNQLSINDLLVIEANKHIADTQPYEESVFLKNVEKYREMVYKKYPQNFIDEVIHLCSTYLSQYVKHTKTKDANSEKNIQEHCIRRIIENCQKNVSYEMLENLFPILDSGDIIVVENCIKRVIPYIRNLDIFATFYKTIIQYFLEIDSFAEMAHILKVFKNIVKNTEFQFMNE